MTPSREPAQDPRVDRTLPDFPAFLAEAEEIFQATREERGGEVADYIPQLARVDPELFGVALCTVDARQLLLGDARTDFCVQSCCKPLNYCMALEEHGEAEVHRHVGHEPSGSSFNALRLNAAGLPHNPMVNAGGIMTCSLIRPGIPLAERFDHVSGVWRALAGGAKPGFSNATYLSERQTADRNFALGYFMREQGAFPEGTDLEETLDFYFQCCSLESTAEAMAEVAATLANGGVHPRTGERIFHPGTVQRCLAMMSSCGLYDFSGEWAFSIGLPGKSGVSGAILVVVPNVMGLCAWSPRLDPQGNSVRGVKFFQQLVERFSLHPLGGLGPRV